MALSISLAGTLGWLTGRLALTRIDDGWVTMKLSTAILCLMACGMVFHFHLKGQRSHVFASCLASGILFFAGFIVADIQADGWAAPISTVGAEKDSLVMTTEPGLPSLGTMVAFTLIGAGGIFYALGTLLMSRITSGLAAVIGGFAIVGYAMKQPWMYYYHADSSTAMAITPATVVFLVSTLLFYLKAPSVPSSTAASPR